MAFHKSSFIKGGIVFLLVVLIDQISKFYMLDYLNINGPQEVTSFFNVVLVWNSGVSFGMFQDLPYGPHALTIFAIIISIALAIWMVRSTKLVEILGLGLIIGGAVGNIIDRVRFGAVIDFLDIHVAGYHWPAFNVADSAIFVGAVLIIIYGLFFETRKDKKKA